jgi:hypothetical protein
LGTALFLGFDRALAINGISESINDTTKQFRSNWNVDLYAMSTDEASVLKGISYNLSGTFYSFAFLDQTI